MPSSSGQKSEVKVDRDRDKRIKDSLAESEKLHGKGIVMRRGDKGVAPPDAISTSSLALDYSIGCGGIPITYITEMYGPEGGGKSTLCLHIIAEANRLGMDALYIDSENSLNLPYAEKLGVNVGRLLVCQPDYGEQGFQVAETFIKNQAVGVVVIDSIAMMVPKAEFEGEIGDRWGWTSIPHGVPSSSEVEQRCSQVQGRFHLYQSNSRHHRWHGLRSYHHHAFRTFAETCGLGTHGYSPDCFVEGW